MSNFIVASAFSPERRVEVFAVRNDKNGYPQFLVYEDRQWVWRSAKNYAPLSAAGKETPVNGYEIE